MVVIRLSRGGKHKSPFYRIVAADQRFPRDGRHLEVLGYYNPVARGNDVELKIELDRVEYWIGVGAQPSKTVASLIKKFRKLNTANSSSAAPTADVEQSADQAEKNEAPAVATEPNNPAS